ncbi:MAG: radical SAM protein, partial [Thermoplasmata archaeon]
MERAWAIRSNNFPPTLNVSVPSAKTYITDHYSNKKDLFVNISITGERCALNCEHCQAKLLESMIPAENPDKLKVIGDALIKKGCKGVLISGGASTDGKVPLNDFLESIRYLKENGLQVIVHTGLVTKDIAKELKDAGVDQVLIDIIGDEETIKKVY